MSVKVINRGSLCFKVYTQKRNNYTMHTLAYRLRGKRHRVVRASWDAIEKQIDSAEKAIAKGDKALADFSVAKRARWEDIEHRCAKAGLSPEQAIALGLEAHERNIRNKIVAKNCPAIVDELLERVHLCAKARRNTETIFHRISTQFPGPLTAYTTEDFSGWISNLPVGPRTRHNHRSALKSLVAYAIKKKYAPADFDPISDIKIELPPVRKSIYTPEELIWLLQFAESYEAGRKLVPLICVTAFAYVRHGEMNEEGKDAALDWSDFRWKTKRIIIDEGVAKRTKRSDGNARVVDMPENLIAWLQPYVKQSGKICSLKHTADALCHLRTKAAREAEREAAKDSGQSEGLLRIAKGLREPKRNALRKSCISYRKAMTRDIEAVADEAGNSPAMIRRNYLRVDEEMKEAAERWFSIMPNRAEVVPLFQSDSVRKASEK